MKKSFKNKIDALGSAIKKNASSTALPQEADNKDLTTELKRNSGKSTAHLSTKAEQSLINFANTLKIEQYDLFPSREYPTPFTRIPLFTPCQRKKARQIESEKTLNSDFIRLNSSWDKGGVYKSGPALTVYDEDTFIGLLHLRKFAYKGRYSSMPSKRIGKSESTVSLNNEKEVLVHSGHFLLTNLETLIRGTKPPKEGWGGAALNKRRESIERIGATILKFTQPQNLDRYRGKQIQIVSIDWVGEKNEAYYYFEFHPAVVLWLNEFRTYIDLNLRRKLTPFGKALHRFLCSQKSFKTFRKDWQVVLTAIGYEGRAAEANRKAKTQLALLVKLEFISSGSITGNGRSEPYNLNITF